MSISTFVALMLLTASADALTLRQECREACADEITACVEQGGRPRACRRQTRRLCRQEGVAVCLTDPPEPLATGIRVPTSVAATAVSSSAIALTWTDTSSREVGFEIERSLTPTGGYFVIAMTGPDAQSYQDNALAVATTYYYRLRSVGPRGGKSSYSAVVSATTFSSDVIPPSVPGGVSAAAASCSQVNVGWNASTDTGGSGLKGYNLYRNAVYVKQVAAPLTSTSDTASPSTAYSYTLRAIDNAGNLSGTSVAANATTPACATTTSTTAPVSTTSTSTPVSTTTSTTTTAANQPPVAKAGPDQFAQTLTTLAFSGSGSSDPDGTIASYSWTFGDGGTAAGVSASHSYATAGIYTVTLRVTDNGSSSATDTAVVTIANRPPVANAGPDKSATAGTSVTLSGSGSDPDGTIASYAWNAGDGASGTGATMTHSYGAPGTYTASLTVTDNLGAQNTDTASVVVTAASNGGTLSWSNSAGNTEDDRGRAVAVDGSGNIYATGQFRSTVNLGGGPMTAFKFSYQPDLPSDVYLVKYGSGGAHLWSKRIGGHGDDSGTAIALDASGNVLVAGFAGPNVDFGGGELPTAGGYDVFVAKYAGSDGHYLWAKRFGSPTDEYPWAIAVDGSGNVLVTGEFTGTIDFGGGALTSAGDRDVFVAKFAGSDGRHLWSRRSGAALMDVGNGIDADASGNVFVTGYFQSAVDFGGGSFTSAGERDIFVAKYAAADGQHLWSKRLGSTSIDEGSSLAVDASGEVVVTGSFVGTIDFGGGPISTPNAGSDAFVVKYSSLGVHRWSKRLGSTNGDSGRAVAIDGAGSVTVTGAFQGAVDFGGGALTSAGSFDIFVAQYRGADGQHVWSRRFGGTGNDRCQSVAANTGTVAVTGYFPGTVNFGDGLRTSAGSNDIFLFDLLP